MTIVFWNCHRKEVNRHLAAIADEHEADILVLAESRDIKGALANLNAQSRRWSLAESRVESKTRLLIRGASSFASPRFDEAPRLSIQEMNFPAKPAFLLAMVHLASSMFYEEEDQILEATDLSSAIGAVERDVGHTRTIVIGDFNMNPFSLGLLSANGFNAVSRRDVAVQESRTLAGKSRSFFYNPMWNLLGDVPEGGTFFATPSRYRSVYWHHLDQVLLRPELLPHFKAGALAILTETTYGSLRNEAGRPCVSDHFPIKLTLDY